MRRDPRQCGHDRSRWTLAALLERSSFLHTRSSSTLSHLLARLGISYQRGRDYVHSPDPEYLEKLAYRDALIERVRAAAARSEHREVVLFLDELTYYRQPTLGADWAQRCSPPGPGVRAQRSLQANTPTRVAATLDLMDARVCPWQGSCFGIAQLVGFYRQVRGAYPAAERIWVVQDNWPVHFHPDVLVALEEQCYPFARRLPPDWSPQPSAKAQKKWGAWQLPIQVVTLPTYASWLNPIEKLWRKLKQELLHLHRWAAQLTELREQVRAYLEAFAHGSAGLLHYVGLSPPAAAQASRSYLPACTHSQLILAA